jgi:regulator of protease activity HflC (stomatin/prohibitin superfamily)
MPATGCEGEGHERRIGRFRNRKEDVVVAIAGATVATLVVIAAVAIFLVVLALLSIRIVRPTHRGLVERLGKYNRYAGPGFHGVLPIVERMYRVDVREVLVEAQPQEKKRRSTTSPTTKTRSSQRIVDLAALRVR